MLSQLPLTDMGFYVVDPDALVPVEYVFFVLAAYQSVGRMMLLYRDVADGIDSPCDDIAKIERDGIIFGDYNDEEYLPDEDWPRFAAMKDGEQFRMGGEVWEKVSFDDIRRTVANKTFVSR